MMKPSAYRRTRLSAAVFALMTLTPPTAPAASVANEPQRPPLQLEQAPAQERQQMYRSSQIIGTPVRNPEGRRIGEIHELVLGSRRGDIAYAIVSFGGIMGVGKTFHPVPWVSLQVRANGRYYVLNADRATIRAAPSFDMGRWPDLADQRWRDAVDAYWARMVGQAPGLDNDPLTAPSGAVSGGTVHSGRASGQAGAGE
jgi:sporulation protein YlmC with PRC-barrel domain